MVPLLTPPPFMAGQYGTFKLHYQLIWFMFVQILVLTGNPAHRPPLVDFANLITKKLSLLICAHVITVIRSFSTSCTLSSKCGLYRHWSGHIGRSVYTRIIFVTITCLVRAQRQDSSIPAHVVKTVLVTFHPLSKRKETFFNINLNYFYNLDFLWSFWEM